MLLINSLKFFYKKRKVEITFSNDFYFSPIFVHIAISLMKIIYTQLTH